MNGMDLKRAGMDAAWLWRGGARVFALALIGLGGAAAAQEAPIADAVEEAEPLWELGLAGGGVYAPHYPAAAQNSLCGVGLPYVIYRGDVFRLGDDSIASGVFVDNERIAFDVSLDAAFDADSDDNDARRGMLDLDFMGEIGPSLTVRLGTIGDGIVDLKLPVRAVFSSDFSRLDYRGVSFSPEVAIEGERLFGADVFYTFSAGPIFGTERLHDYFYEVDEAFQTADRAAYDADLGYLGSEFSFGFGNRITDRLSVFYGGQVGYFGGAANEDSPLHREDVTLGIGAGFTWSFWRSEARASAPRGR